MHLLFLLLILLSSPLCAQEVAIGEDERKEERAFFKALLDEGLEGKKQQSIYQDPEVVQQTGAFYEIVTIKVLNKSSGKAKELKVKIGDTAKIGYLIIRPVSCWQSRERYLFPDIKVLLEVYKEIEHNLKRIFYGWVMGQDYFSPIIEDKRYDIIIKSCS